MSKGLEVVGVFNCTDCLPVLSSTTPQKVDRLYYRLLVEVKKKSANILETLLSSQKTAVPVSPELGCITQVTM